MENKPNRGTYEYNKEYAKKYRASKTEIKLTVTPEIKNAIVAAAAEVGESVTRYMLTATQIRMDKENKNQNEHL